MPPRRAPEGQNQVNAAYEANVAPMNNQAQMVEQFRRYAPPTFNGKEEAIYVEDWFRSLERVFKLLACTDVKRVLCAEYQLVEGADRWWKGYWRTRNEQEREALTWNEFKEILRAQYYPRFYREQKEREFWDLRQEGMSVTNYEGKFTKLSRFATHLVDTDLGKARRFLDGIRPGIRHILKSHGDLSYAETVKRAQEIAASQDMDQKQVDNPRKRKGEDLNRNGSNNHDKEGKMDVNNQGDQHDKPLCKKCGKNHYGECLVGMNVCYRCKQKGHMAQICPVYANNNGPEKKGTGGRARIYNMQRQNDGEFT